MFDYCFGTDFIDYSDHDLDRLGITSMDHLSAASIRALQWPDIGNEWFIEYKVFDLKGDLAYEDGVVKRDHGENPVKVKKKGDFDSHKVHNIKLGAYARIHE